MVTWPLSFGAVNVTKPSSPAYRWGTADAFTLLAPAKCCVETLRSRLGVCATLLIRVSPVFLAGVGAVADLAGAFPRPVVCRGVAANRRYPKAARTNVSFWTLTAMNVALQAIWLFVMGGAFEEERLETAALRRICISPYLHRMRKMLAAMALCRQDL